MSKRKNPFTKEDVDFSPKRTGGVHIFSPSPELTIGSEINHIATWALMFFGYVPTKEAENKCIEMINKDPQYFEYHMLVCTIAMCKPLDGQNATNVIRARIGAFDAGQKATTPIPTTYNYDLVINNSQKLLDTRTAVSFRQHVIDDDYSNDTPYVSEWVTQLRMLCAYYGCTLLQFVEPFVNEGNGALFLRAVGMEMATLKGIMNTFPGVKYMKAKGSNSGITYQQYPNAFYAILSWAKREGKLTRNYNDTNLNTTISKRIIDQAVESSSMFKIFSSLDPDFKTALESLGIVGDIASKRNEFMAKMS